jgi:hypothetical protein
MEVKDLRIHTSQDRVKRWGRVELFDNLLSIVGSKRKEIKPKF